MTRRPFLTLTVVTICCLAGSLAASDFRHRCRERRHPMTLMTFALRVSVPQLVLLLSAPAMAQPAVAESRPLPAPEDWREEQ